MKRTTLTTALAATSVLSLAVIAQSISGSLDGQPHATLPAAQCSNCPSKLNLRIMDVSTGWAVVPEQVELVQRENKDIRVKLTTTEGLNTTTLPVLVHNGTYDVTVSAKGYVTMSSFFQLQDQTLNVNFHMESLVPVKELSSGYIQALHREEAMVVVGFIVDDATGKPMGGVAVHSMDNAVTTTSSDKGYFQMVLPLPSFTEEIFSRNALAFTRSGYTTEIRKNFDMWPNGDMILQVRMNEGQGTSETDVLLRREASISFK